MVLYMILDIRTVDPVAETLSREFSLMSTGYGSYGLLIISMSNSLQGYIETLMLIVVWLPLLMRPKVKCDYIVLERKEESLDFLTAKYRVHVP